MRAPLTAMSPGGWWWKVQEERARWIQDSLHAVNLHHVVTTFRYKLAMLWSETPLQHLPTPQWVLWLDFCEGGYVAM